MPSPTPKAKLEREEVNLRTDLIQWYRNSLAQIPPTAKPADLQAVITAGIKLISFAQTTTQKRPPAIPQHDDVLEAFNKLAEQQSQQEQK